MKKTYPLLKENYIPSFKTNLKATFARLRREQKAAEQKERDNRDEAILKVRKLG